MQPRTPSRLRAARLAVGLSQEALARKVECSAQTIRLAEHGMGSEEMRQRIAAALDVDVSDIWPEAANPIGGSND